MATTDTPSTRSSGSASADTSPWIRAASSGPFDTEHHLVVQYGFPGQKLAQPPATVNLLIYAYQHGSKRYRGLRTVTIEIDGEAVEAPVEYKLLQTYRAPPNIYRAIDHYDEELTIALDQDIAPVIEVMRETGAQLRANSVFGPKILEDLDIAGIENWNERGITLRARFKVRALEQSNVKREYLMRLKHAFDKADIQQPRSTVTIMERAAPARAPEGPPQ